MGLEEGCEDQGLHSHELDEDVQGGAGCVLEGVSHGVTDHGGLVCVGALASQRAGVLGGLSLHSQRNTPVSRELVLAAPHPSDRHLP